MNRPARPVSRRFQMVLRDQGWSNHVPVPSHIAGLTGIARQAAQMMAGKGPLPLWYARMDGVLEAPVGVVTDESLFAMVLDIGTMTLHAGAGVEPIHSDRGSTATMGLHDLMREEIWRGPNQMLPSGMLAGRVAVRACRLPARPGHECFMMLGLLCATEPLGKLPAAMLEAEGPGQPDEGGMSIRYSKDPLMLPPLGSAADAIFKLPIWGWERENKLAFQSTLPLATLDRLDQARNTWLARAAADPTLDDASCLKELDRAHDLDGILTSGARDQDFLHFLKLRHRMLPVMAQRGTGTPLTAAQLAADEAVNSRAVREVMHEAEGEENEDCPAP